MGQLARQMADGRVISGLSSPKNSIAHFTDYSTLPLEPRLVKHKSP
jgi:hypothetical protein